MYEATFNLSSDHMDAEYPFIETYRELCELDGGIDYDTEGLSVNPSRVWVSRELMSTWLSKHDDETWTMSIVSWGPKVDDDLEGLQARVGRNWVMVEI